MKLLDAQFIFDQNEQNHLKPMFRGDAVIYREPVLYVEMPTWRK